ncbi:fumarylacetoacetate hydrolase family protein [Thalassotalea ganghwensis]
MKKALILLTWLLSQATQANQIAPLETALSLSHVDIGNRDHTIAVLSDSNGFITGINLSSLTKQYLTPVAMYQKMGYEQITTLINNANEEHKVTLSYDSLISPAGQSRHHIALGFNYSEHADEVSAERKPFLFVKNVLPTRDQTVVHQQQRLLDYEIEICAKPLKTLKPSNLDKLELGYFLCGDFTDRATLLREMNLDNIRSGEGFRSAKSMPGYFPTGPYLVIPKQQRKFLEQIDFTLTRNQKVVQQANAGQMIWEPATAIEQLFLLADNRHSELRSNENWFPYGKFDENITLLTGTPAGVIMRPPSIGFKILMGTWYFLGFNFLDDDYQSPRDFVVKQYIETLLDEKSFLQPGEKISMSADFLGSIDIQIN